jgi:uncharacterized protein (DUF1778 family)
MEKKRIQVYADETMKRRIELAAAKHHMAVTEYCLQAITQQLADDEMLEAEQFTLTVSPALSEEFIANLRALQAKIKARRGGQPIDIDRIMQEMREERDRELTGLP